MILLIVSLSGVFVLVHRTSYAVMSDHVQTNNIGSIGSGREKYTALNYAQQWTTTQTVVCGVRSENFMPGRLGDFYNHSVGVYE